MMLRKILMTATVLTLFGTTIHAQKSYNGEAEKTQDMQKIVNGLKLEIDQIYALGPIMETRKAEKQNIAGQITAVQERRALTPEDNTAGHASLDEMEKNYKLQMAEADKRAFDQAENLMTPSQKTMFQKDIRKELAAKEVSSVKKVDAPKK